MTMEHFFLFSSRGLRNYVIPHPTTQIGGTEWNHLYIVLLNMGVQRRLTIFYVKLAAFVKYEV